MIAHADVPLPVIRPPVLQMNESVCDRPTNLPFGQVRFGGEEVLQGTGYAWQKQRPEQCESGPSAPMYPEPRVSLPYIKNEEDEPSLQLSVQGFNGGREQATRATVPDESLPVRGSPQNDNHQHSPSSPCTETHRHLNELVKSNISLYTVVERASAAERLHHYSGNDSSNDLSHEERIEQAIRLKDWIDNGASTLL